jgi:hypothetical protein
MQAPRDSSSMIARNESGNGQNLVLLSVAFKMGGGRGAVFHVVCGFV